MKICKAVFPVAGLNLSIFCETLDFIKLSIPHFEEALTVTVSTRDHRSIIERCG